MKSNCFIIAFGFFIFNPIRYKLKIRRRDHYKFWRKDFCFPHFWVVDTKLNKIVRFKSIENNDEVDFWKQLWYSGKIIKHEPNNKYSLT